jgi:hypothetical protein
MYSSVCAHGVKLPEEGGTVTTPAELATTTPDHVHRRGRATTIWLAASPAVLHRTVAATLTPRLARSAPADPAA